DGKIIFYCLNDEKEEKLFVNLDQHLNKNNNQSRRLKNLLSSKITNYYVEKYNSFKSSFNSESLKPACLTAYKSIYKEIQSPPPKLS
ncbi:MAG: hypothetical protein ABI638_06405, partial [Ignavibacteriota bacterium]